MVRRICMLPLLLLQQNRCRGADTHRAPCRVNCTKDQSTSELICTGSERAHVNAFGLGVEAQRVSPMP